ncbi:MAG: hypothetical protein H6739_26435 [Alphaproteobacteria bacterium]|nr:hypothetical protein [Alphaproteobacteria bacterium]
MALPTDTSAVRRLLDRYRRDDARDDFTALGDRLAREAPARALALCLPNATAKARRALLRVDESDLLLRPCFGAPGTTLTLRSREGLRTLLHLGPQLGPGLVRLVVVAGVGQDGLAEVLTRLPLDSLMSLRMEGQGLRSRQPVIFEDHDNVVHLRITGDDPVIRAVAALPALRDLRLCDNRIGPAGARSLSTLASLRRLDLRGNALGDEGAIALSTHLGLQDLRLEDNCIGPAGALAIATMQNLTFLDLSRNPVGEAAIAALSAMPGLDGLRVEGCTGPHTVRTRLLHLGD